MERWYVATKKADFDAWGRRLGISPVLARILRNRDLTEEADLSFFLHGTIRDCHDPLLLKDMDKAVAEILTAIRENRKLRVVGDYDVDGICSTYILTRGIELLGGNVDMVIPHRIQDGYGLNESIICKAAQDGRELLITCDNGIAAADQIELAGQLGMKVIVTDHHEVPYVTNTELDRQEILPKALAVVDPKRAEDTYPFPEICGAMVAYKLIQALTDAAELQETDGADVLRQELENLTEFVALATVCDVMELRDENRIMVKEGLKHMEHTANEGLRALLMVNQLTEARLTGFHCGFVIGPCLNASGRLDSAYRALELFRCSSHQEAMKIAGELKDMNDSRKKMTQDGVEEAEEYIAQHDLLRQKVWIIFLPKLHESLAGIVAGRIKEKYCHPVFVLTRGEESVKGSGRSIEGYHMFQAMSAVAELFIRFGGHAMAAGLSIQEENIELLREQLNRQCVLNEEDFIPKIHIDVPMPLSYADMGLARELELLEPFGVGNPKPLFAQKNLQFLRVVEKGKSGRAREFLVRTQEGMKYALMQFGDASLFYEFLTKKYGEDSVNRLKHGEGEFEVSVAYQLDINTFRGRESLQYIMQYFC